MALTAARKKPKEDHPNEVYLVIRELGTDGLGPVAYASWSKGYCHKFVREQPWSDRYKVIGPYLRPTQATPEKR